MYICRFRARGRVSGLRWCGHVCARQDKRAIRATQETLTASVAGAETACQRSNLVGFPDRRLRRVGCRRRRPRRKCLRASSINDLSLRCCVGSPSFGAVLGRRIRSGFANCNALLVRDSRRLCLAPINLRRMHASQARPGRHCWLRRQTSGRSLCLSAKTQDSTSATMLDQER